VGAHLAAQAESWRYAYFIRIAQFFDRIVATDLAIAAIHRRQALNIII